MLRRATTTALPVIGSSREMLKRVAAANQELNLKPISLIYAFKVFLLVEWMGIGSRVPTQDLASQLKDNYVNIGVVAALLLTLISLDTSLVGDEMDAYGVNHHIAAQVFAFLVSLALWLLFIAVLHCLFCYCYVSELNCIEEVMVWNKSTQGITHILHFCFFASGFFLYIVAQIWLAATVLPPIQFFVSLGVLLLTFPIALYGTLRNIQGLYKAKFEVAKAYATAFDGVAESETMVEPVAPSGSSNKVAPAPS